MVLELVHKTLLEEIPYAMCAFQGKVLIGVKNLVRLYDLGKKKLLRKSENKVSSPILRFNITGPLNFRPRSFTISNHTNLFLAHS